MSTTNIVLQNANDTQTNAITDLTGSGLNGFIYVTSGDPVGSGPGAIVAVDEAGSVIVIPNTSVILISLQDQINDIVSGINYVTKIPFTSTDNLVSPQAANITSLDIHSYPGDDGSVAMMTLTNQDFSEFGTNVHSWFLDGSYNNYNDSISSIFWDASGNFTAAGTLSAASAGFTVDDSANVVTSGYIHANTAAFGSSGQAAVDASGNLSAITLSINGGFLTVDDAGNQVTSGYIHAGVVQALSEVIVTSADDAGFSYVHLENTHASGHSYDIGVGGPGSSFDKLYFYDSKNALLRMTLENDGTFHVIGSEVIGEDLTVIGTVNPSLDTNFGGSLRLPIGTPGVGVFTSSSESDEDSVTVAGGTSTSSASGIFYGYANPDFPGYIVLGLGGVGATDPALQISSQNNSNVIAQFNDNGKIQISSSNILGTLDDVGTLTLSATSANDPTLGAMLLLNSFTNAGNFQAIIGMGGGESPPNFSVYDATTSSNIVTADSVNGIALLYQVTIPTISAPPSQIYSVVIDDNGVLSSVAPTANASVVAYEGAVYSPTNGNVAQTLTTLWTASPLDAVIEIAELDFYFAATTTAGTTVTLTLLSGSDTLFSNSGLALTTGNYNLHLKLAAATSTVIVSKTDGSTLFTVTNPIAFNTVTSSTATLTLKCQTAGVSSSNNLFVLKYYDVRVGKGG